MLGTNEFRPVSKHISEIVYSKPHFEWLLSEEQLTQVEASVRTRSIWIISPDLSKDTRGAIFRDAVKTNIKRRMTYTYVVPDTELVLAQLHGLQALFNTARDLIEIHVMPQDDFRMLAITEIAIYNPSNSEQDIDARQVYLELPIREGQYWVRLDEEAALSVVGRFSRIITAGEYRKRLSA